MHTLITSKLHSALHLVRGRTHFLIVGVRGMRCAFLCLLIVLGAFASSAFAGGCPPWLPCGKYKNLITPDSDGYNSAINAAPSSASSVEPPNVSSAPLNIERELANNVVAIGNAQREAARLQVRERDLRNSNGSSTIFDEPAVGNR